MKTNEIYVKLNLTESEIDLIDKINKTELDPKFDQWDSIVGFNSRLDDECYEKGIEITDLNMHGIYLLTDNKFIKDYISEFNPKYVVNAGVDTNLEYLDFYNKELIAKSGSKLNSTLYKLSDEVLLVTQYTRFSNDSFILIKSDEFLTKLLKLANYELSIKVLNKFYGIKVREYK